MTNKEKEVLIIIVLVLVVWSAVALTLMWKSAEIIQQKGSYLKQCNEFYQEQIELVCPRMLNSYGNIDTQYVFTQEPKFNTLPFAPGGNKDD